MNPDLESIAIGALIGLSPLIAVFGFIGVMYLGTWCYILYIEVWEKITGRTWELRRGDGFR